MIRKIKGFTLVELIVAILIISILATIAVPIYSAMIWKSRFAEVFAVVGTIAAAEKIYYLQNESYPISPLGECYAGHGYPSGGTEVQKRLGISVDQSSYFKYLIYPGTGNTNWYNIYFAQPGYDWAWFYVYAPGGGGTTQGKVGWEVYPGDDSDAKKHFTPPK